VVELPKNEAQKALDLLGSLALNAFAFDVSYRRLFVVGAIEAFHRLRASPAAGFTAKDAEDPLDDAKGWLTYNWDLGDGESPVNVTTKTIDYMYKKPTTGTPYIVTLTVFDKLVYSPVTTQSKIYMNVTNADPTVSFTVEGTQILGTYAINKNLTFKPKVVDENLTTCTYAWDFKDGTTANNKTDLEHTFQSGGKYTVTLTVTDDSGAIGTFASQVAINTPPIAKIAAPSAAVNGTTFKIGQEVQFSASGSTDADGDALAYVWESNKAGILYDGADVNFAYIFDSPSYVGVHTITLTVRDNKAMPETPPSTIMVMVQITLLAADQRMPELLRPSTGPVAHEPLSGTMKPRTATRWPLRDRMEAGIAVTGGPSGTFGRNCARPG
jgi:PKD repeat protein